MLIIYMLWTLLFSFTAHSQVFSRNKIDLECKHLYPIQQAYLSRHITYSKTNKNIEVRTIDQFIKKLDPSKIYLLESDVKQIEKKLDNIFASTIKGLKNSSNDAKVTAAQNPCKGLNEAYEIYRKRFQDRVSFVKSFLNKDFKLDKNTEFIFDPDERKRPKTLTEANNFSKKYIQFQIANYIATDSKLEEAKANVVKNYERMLKQVMEQTDQDLYSLYLDAYAHALDPHSSYLSADQLEDFEISMRLSLEGIGATLSSKDGFTVIEQLIPGGAAERSGKLKPKDKIIAVSQEGNDKYDNVIDMRLRDVVSYIRGKKGTTVKLKVLRKTAKGQTKPIEVSLIRDKIKLEDEAASIEYFDKDINGKKLKLGIINLPSFYADNRGKGRSATKDMAKLIKQARESHVDGIVLDLSTNGGGSLEDAVNIAGLFFKTGNVVKQSRRDPSKGEIELADQDPTVNWAGPLVVLISRISASASEIVSGTLKDYERAVIVGGDHTFGKGSVQSVEPLPPGLGALKTTVGMFFTPGGNSTQHRGVTSDIPLPSAYNTDDIGEKTLDYSLPPKKIKSFRSSSAYVIKGNDKWEKVNSSEILKLKEASAKRVAENKEFKKLVEDIAKAKKKGKVIKVSEVLDKDDKKNAGDEDEEDSDKVLSKEEKLKKYRERPDIQESLNVLTDLIAVKRNQPIMTIGESGHEKKKDNHKN
ncbi:MAG: carboxy terminal-processing peptidase [Bdellovibrionales bacterium]|nr:carboxy terminal-processing peptidase [Bdellovibrionales bacterium]